MKKLRMPLIILLVIAGLVFIKVKFLSSNQEQPGPQGKADKKQPVASVSGIVIRTESLESTIFSTGTVIANKEIDLQPETSGKIIGMNIHEGSRVGKGALLVKINDSELRAQLKKLSYDLALNKQKADRAKQLLEINGVSREDYESLVTEINTTKAEMELVRAQLAKTELRAPFSGVIGFKNVNEGSYVSTSTKIATLQQLDPLKLDFSVPEKYSGKIRRGDEIVFTIQGNSRKYRGRVYAIDPQIDVNTRNVMVRALCPNSGAEILPGSFAKVEIGLQHIGDAIMIPTQALIPVLKGYKVFVSQGGKARQVDVQIGIRTDAKVQILSGLTPNDTLLTTGVMMLKPDAPVSVSIRQ